MGFDVTTSGNHEFEFGSGPLAQTLLTAKILRKGKLPVLVVSNTVEDPVTGRLLISAKSGNPIPSSLTM